MPKYKITIEYDGTNYAGWQKQPDLPTVQGMIEEAIYAFSNERVETYGSGRTDAGVHAYGQVAHFSLRKDFADFKVCEAINYYLRNKKIVITNSEIVAEDFHARFTAKKKLYEYIIINRRLPLALWHGRAWLIREKLDLEKMQQAAKAFIGEYDFSSFRDSECQAKNPIRTIDDIKIIREGEIIRLQFRAQSFLHHQVRIMVGTLRNIGSGKWQAKDITKIIKQKARKAAGETAPACGLYLISVNY